MPAQFDEIHAAEEEGVHIICLGAPLRLESDDGPFGRLICQKMTLGEFDARSRRKPVPVPGNEFVLQTDQVVLAIGQQLDVTDEIRRIGVGVSRSGQIEIMTGKHTRTAGTLIFAGGDAVRGPDTVIGAVADGHLAAGEIDAAIREKNNEPAFEPQPMESVSIPGLIDAEPQISPRILMPEADPAFRKTDFREVELGLSPEQALAEACRCLQCNVKV
jgi:NADPH-dependent glutamate synthase beta subunit-like oxidoreductase